MVGAVVSLLISIAPGVFGGYWIDPAPDTLPSATTPALDLGSVAVTFSPGEMTVSLTLDSGGPTFDSVDASAYIDFDADLDSGTWRPTHIQDYELLPAPDLGVDYYILLMLSSGHGTADLFEVGPDGIETWLATYSDADGAITFDGFTVSVTLPRCAAPGGMCLGARYGAAVLLGNNDGPTDRAPNGSVGLIAEPVKGDFNEDGDVDDEDLEHMEACLSGPAVPQTQQSCLDAKLDEDADVDQDDFGILQQNYTGSY